MGPDTLQCLKSRCKYRQNSPIRGQLGLKNRKLLFQRLPAFLKAAGRKCREVLAIVSWMF